MEEANSGVCTRNFMDVDLTCGFVLRHLEARKYNTANSTQGRHITTITPFIKAAFCSCQET